MKLSDGTIISSSLRSSELDLEHGPSRVPRHTQMKIGTVISVRYIDSTDGLQKSADNNSEGQQNSPYETVYDVKVDDMMARPFIYNGCKVLKTFYGPNNFFEVIHESADYSPAYIEDAIYKQTADSLAGARCVLLFLEGQPSAPVILGFLGHPGRKSKITKDKGIHLGFEFNGVNVQINKSGAFTLTASGPLLPPVATPTGPIPEIDVRQDPINGPLTIEIDESFNFKLADVIGQTISITHDTPLSGAMEIGNGGDFIRIEKAIAGGTISVNSSKDMSIAALSLTIGGTADMSLSTAKMMISADATFEIKAGDFKFNATIGAEFKAMQMKLESQTTFAVKCAKMKFTGASGELLAILKEIFDGIGASTPASPVGPCAPIQAAPQWTAAVMPALLKLQALMG